MNQFLLMPPVAFVIVFLTMVAVSALLKGIAFHKDRQSLETRKPYACGEDFTQDQVQPDYSQFFPYAFFFTILHVVALMIATVPIASIGSLTIAVIFVFAAIIGLIILLRK